jgi:hypothetical protein
MRGSDRSTWLKLGIVGILLFIAAYGLVVLESGQEGEKSPKRRTTYSANAGGYKALYLWLKKLDIPIKRWERKLDYLPPEASVLLLAEPEHGPVSGELNALKEWVRQGGTFILVAGFPNAFLEEFNLSLEPRLDFLSEKKFAETLTFQPGPYTRGVKTLKLGDHSELKPQRPEGVIHLRSESGGLLAVLEEGQGRVIALSDPNLFCNKFLREADHARLAFNLLLSHGSKGTVLVDEYHHGYGRATSVMSHLARSRAMQPLIQVGILLLILWTVKGRRFGLPRPLIQEERRSSLEYVKAMAQLLQRAKARVLAFEALIRWTEGEAKRILVSADRDLQKKLLSAQERVKEQQITERELLVSVRGLYAALDRARSKATHGV